MVRARPSGPPTAEVCRASIALRPGCTSPPAPSGREPGRRQPSGPGRGDLPPAAQMPSPVGVTHPQLVDDEVVVAGEDLLTASLQRLARPVEERRLHVPFVRSRLHDTVEQQCRHVTIGPRQGLGGHMAGGGVQLGDGDISVRVALHPGRGATQAGTQAPLQQHLPVVAALPDSFSRAPSMCCQPIALRCSSNGRSASTCSAVPPTAMAAMPTPPAVR
jgi:hypothetical protein